MYHARAARRSVLLALTLLSACAASEATSDGADDLSGGPIGNFLAGRLAMSEGDTDKAADFLLKAYAESPPDPDLTLQAFIAAVEADRPEAITLARLLPESEVADLVLADVDVKAGHWQAAEQRYRALPRQGMTQLLQPLLTAWSQQGDGRTEAALVTLAPYVENARFQGLFALHAGMIADIGGRPEDAGRFYQVADQDMQEPNLRLAQIIASWQARGGHPADAQHTLAALPSAAPDLGIAMPGMLSSVTRRPVNSAVEGIAEAYFDFAALLRAQSANDFALLVLRLALDLRPDFAAARLLSADIQMAEHHPEVALGTLNEIPATDSISAVVRLRKAALLDRLGRTDEAMRDLTSMAKDFPDSPLPEEQRADILRTGQHFGEAIAAYDNAIARIVQPVATDWIIFYNRGVAEERSNQWPKAEADFQHALKLAPNQPFVLNYLGYSWADKNEHLPQARQMIELAARERPDDGAIVDSLGWVELRMGDPRNAVKTLERAAEMETEDSTVNGHLGDAYWAVGRKIEAEYQWRRALTLHPTADETVKLEAKLGTAKTAAVDNAH